MRLAPRLAASLLLALAAGACVVKVPPAPTPVEEQVVKAGAKPTAAPGKVGGLLPQPDTPPVGGLLPQPDTPPVGGLLPQPDTPPVGAAATAGAAIAMPAASAAPASADMAKAEPMAGPGLMPTAPLVGNNGSTLKPPSGPAEGQTVPDTPVKAGSPAPSSSPSPTPTPTP